MSRENSVQNVAGKQWQEKIQEVKDIFFASLENQSRPRTGAWIETDLEATADALLTVAPTHGRVD